MPPRRPCIGATTSGVFASGAETFLFQLQGQAGQQLYYDALISARIANVSIIHPNNSVLRVTNIADDANLITLPVTGTYLVSVAGFAPAASPWSFRLLDIASAPTVSLDTQVSGQVAGLESTLYRLPLAPGQFVGYDGIQTTAPVTFRAFDSQGGELLAIQAGNDGTIAPAAGGTYLLVFQGSGTAANFSFRMSDIFSATPVALSVPVEFDIESNQALVVSFPVIVGHDYFYDANSPTGSINGTIFDSRARR